SFYFFFFSSRRRHTRWPRDWSSDVCSSDLVPQNSTVEAGIRELGLKITTVDLTRATVFEKGCVYIVPLLEELNLPEDTSAWANQIGRASCRERVWIEVVGGSVERKDEMTWS